MGVSKYTNIVITLNYLNDSVAGDFVSKILHATVAMEL